MFVVQTQHLIGEENNKKAAIIFYDSTTCGHRLSSWHLQPHLTATATLWGGCLYPRTYWGRWKYCTSVLSVSLSVLSDSLWPPWSVAHQTSLSSEFSRQVHWGGQPFPSPGDLPDQREGSNPDLWHYRWILYRLSHQGSPSVNLLKSQRKWKSLVLSRVGLFATPWTVAHQAPLSRGIFQARILEWVAIPFSSGSSRPRDWM